MEAEEKRKSQARDRQAAYRLRHGVGVKVTPNGPRNVTRNVTRDRVTEIEKETETRSAQTGSLQPLIVVSSVGQKGES
jgi:hypothetical protein